MKSRILTVMKKELARFFGDRRLMVSILIPGVLIYFLYSFMGGAMGDMFAVDEDYVPKILVQNMPQSVGMLTESLNAEFKDSTDTQAAKKAVEESRWDLAVVFPADFDQAVAAYDPASGEAAPHVQVYYNTANTNSQVAYELMTALLDAYESTMANKFDINLQGDYDLATEEDTMGMLFAMLMPMLLMMFMFSGCVSVAPESIAGEKERGTIATMLITPIRRSDIAVGKILALAVVALLSGASSTLGTVLSLPKLMGGAMGDEMSANIYGAKDYALLAAVILSTVLLMVTMISIISAFARTVKEAQSSAVPLQVIVTILGASAMFGGSSAAQELWKYAIPLYNSAQCIVGVFSFSVMTSGVALTVAVNLALTVAGVVVLARMFNSEKVIFAK